MIKYFCDCCGDEIVDGKNEIPSDHFRLKASVRSKDGKHKLRVEILTKYDECANAGSFCRYCVLDAIYKLDDRPSCGEDK